MKILLMGFSKLKYIPYLRFYLDNIDDQEHDIHVLYWNRDKKPENLADYENVTLHEFSKCQEDNVRISSKIPNFIRYRQYAKKLIRRGNYDFIIFLHSFPGVLLSNVLTRKYRGRYIYDYRDSTYEKYGFFKKIIHKLVNCSYATFVSSDGFRQLLPQEAKEKIYTSHNFIKESLDHREDKKRYGTSADAIRISYWGFIRDEKTNCLMMDRLANDPRFELHYYGREDRLTDRLKAYANEKKAENIWFHGEYVPEDRYRFICTTDLIHNVFGNRNMMIAMSNRFYDGAIFRIPQLCMKNAIMGNRVENAGIGFSCDPQNENYADAVYDYYMSLDHKAFEEACDNELERVLEEYHRGCQVIREATKRIEKENK
ncbi:MAG: glycosyltransferase family 4 protein [Ruminococcaceae bacterium]|nr:glycosyltransferase family 4 protein [Oscillospiraceae bacterium]